MNCIYFANSIRSISFYCLPLIFDRVLFRQFFGMVSFHKPLILTISQIIIFLIVVLDIIHSFTRILRLKILSSSISLQLFIDNIMTNYYTMIFLLQSILPYYNILDEAINKYNHIKKFQNKKFRKIDCLKNLRYQDNICSIKFLYNIVKLFLQI